MVVLRGRLSRTRRAAVGVACGVQRHGRGGMCGSGLVGGTRVEGLSGWQLAAGDDEDVDAGGTGLLENPPYDPPAHGDVRPAAVDRADQDLGDLVLLREADDRPGGVVLLYLVPAGAEIGCQCSQPV